MNSSAICPHPAYCHSLFMHIWRIMVTSYTITINWDTPPFISREVRPSPELTRIICPNRVHFQLGGYRGISLGLMGGRVFSFRICLVRMSSAFSSAMRSSSACAGSTSGLAARQSAVSSPEMASCSKADLRSDSHFSWLSYSPANALNSFSSF